MTTLKRIRIVVEELLGTPNLNDAISYRASRLSQIWAALSIVVGDSHERRMLRAVSEFKRLYVSAHGKHRIALDRLRVLASKIELELHLVERIPIPCPTCGAVTLVRSDVIYCQSCECVMREEEYDEIVTVILQTIGKTG